MIRKEIIQNSVNNKELVAVTDPELSFSYDDLLSISKKLEWLKGKKVAIALPKSSKYVSLIFAAILNKFTFIPIDLSQPIARINEIINDSNPDIIVSDIPISFNNLNSISYDDLVKIIESSNYIDLESYCAYIIYTSGSTGKPKGVMLSNQGLYNVISQQVTNFNLNKSNIFFYVNTIFDASISDMLCSFLSSSTLFINDSIRTKFKKLEKFLHDYKISYIDLPPSVLSFLDFSNLPNLKTIIIGGEIPNFTAIHKNLKYVDIYNVYGPTEFSICTSLYKCDYNFTTPIIGNPLSNIEYTIIDNELYISGIGMAIGYTNNELTTKSFVFINNKKYYKTGDMVSFEQNNYIFNGRTDSQIKHKGNLVNLEEINSIIKNIESVQDCFCYYLHDEIYLFIEGYLHNNIQLNKILPKYMIPKYIFDNCSFKRNKSNKIDKQHTLSKYDFFLYNQSKELFNKYIKPNNAISPINSINDTILLTGSNGFLGIHLLEKLSKTNTVYCLIRSDTEANALLKIKKAASYYNLDINYNNVKVQLGDCLQQNLGLPLEFCNLITKVIHTAAKVNNLKTHDELFNDNVIGTINVLNFCITGSIKQLEYISTLSVYVSKKHSTMFNCKEEPLTFNNLQFTNGYASTKYQAEILVTLFQKTYNQNVNIYRLGLLTESTNNNIVLSKSFLYKTFKILKTIESLPLLDKEIFIDLSPINLVVSNLAELFANNSKPNIFNISYNIKLSLKDLIDNNNSLNLIEKESWIKKYKSNLIIHLFSIIDPNQLKINMNIFETTYVTNFDNNNLKQYCNYPEIDAETIKKHYFNIWSQNED